jgi:hypothetical protein
MDSDEPLLTVHESVKLVRKKLGVPLSVSRWHKDRMNGVGPEPAAIFGRHFLYRPQDALDYGRSLLRTPTSSKWKSIGEAADRALEHLNNNSNE